MAVAFLSNWHHFFQNLHLNDTKIRNQNSILVLICQIYSDWKVWLDLTCRVLVWMAPARVSDNDVFNIFIEFLFWLLARSRFFTGETIIVFNCFKAHSHCIESAVSNDECSENWKNPINCIALVAGLSRIVAVWTSL